MVAAVQEQPHLCLSVPPTWLFVSSPWVQEPTALALHESAYSAAMRERW